VILKQLKKRLREDITAPCLAEVQKGYIKQQAGGYCVDAEKLIPGNLERTGEVLKAVSCNPIWTGPAGQGLYCPPAAGQIAVVQFINFDSAFPFIAGYWSDDYTPADGKENAFILTDGMGGVLELSGGLFALVNNLQSLKTILETMVDKISAIITMDPTGATPPQAVSPTSITDLQTVKALLAQLFSR